MKILYKKIISMVLILSVLLGLFVVPASATGGAAVDYVQTEFWKLLTFNYKEMDYGLAFWKNLLKKFLAPGVTEETATAEDWKSVYRKYSDMLPANRVSSDGFNLHWGYRTSVCKDNICNNNVSGAGHYINSSLEAGFSYIDDVPFFLRYVKPSIHCINELYLKSDFTVPCAGVLTLDFPIYHVTDSIYMDTVFCLEPFAGTTDNGTLSPSPLLISGFAKSLGNRSDVSVNSGKVDFTFSGPGEVMLNICFRGISGSSVSSFYMPTATWKSTVPTESVEFVPVEGTRTCGVDNNIPLGRLNEKGVLIANTVKVFDESTLLYTNPWTGVATPVKKWSYDYFTRTYTLTLDSLAIVTLEYKDEIVLLKEGTTSRTLYYIRPTAVTPSPSPSVSPSPLPSPGCQHVYTDKILQKPTCTVAGSMERSCSLCGGSIIERIPASGHDWLLTNSVADVLGTDGKVVTEGYDLYKCSVCHLEYKDFARTGPPGKDVGNSISKLITDLFDSLGVLIGKGIDWLLSLGAKAMAGFTQVTDFFAKQAALVGGFGGGFLLFLSSAFALIPPELLACITFALICAVLGKRQTAHSHNVSGLSFQT